MFDSLYINLWTIYITVAIPFSYKKEELHVIYVARKEFFDGSSQRICWVTQLQLINSTLHRYNKEYHFEMSNEKLQFKSKYLEGNNNCFAVACGRRYLEEQETQFEITNVSIIRCFMLHPQVPAEAVLCCTLQTILYIR